MFLIEELLKVVISHVYRESLKDLLSLSRISADCLRLAKEIVNIEEFPWDSYRSLNVYEFVKIDRSAKVAKAYHLELHVHQCMLCLSGGNPSALIFQPCLEIFEHDDVEFFKYQKMILFEVYNSVVAQDFLDIHFAISKKYPRIHGYLLTLDAFNPECRKFYLNLSDQILTMISDFNKGLDSITAFNKYKFRSFQTQWINTGDTYKKYEVKIVTSMPDADSQSFNSVTLYCGKCCDDVRKFEWKG